MHEEEMHLNPSIDIRPATAADAPTCVDLRGRTRQNAFSVAQLAAIGVTVDSWADGVRQGSMPGVVAWHGAQMVGYCFGDRDSGEVVVLALLPDWEGLGLGRELLDRMVTLLRAAGHARLFLGCSADPATRSHGFYRHLGWRAAGGVDAAGDEVLELLPD
jgi:GNAT superfamily N-acetyltransferase